MVQRRTASGRARVADQLLMKPDDIGSVKLFVVYRRLLRQSVVARESAIDSRVRQSIVKTRRVQVSTNDW